MNAANVWPAAWRENSRAMQTSVFLAILLNCSCSTKYFKKSVDEIVFSVFFSTRKRITVEIELIHVCTRGRKTCILTLLPVLLQKSVPKSYNA